MEDEEDTEFVVGAGEFEAGDHIYIHTLDGRDAAGFLVRATAYGITYQATHRAIQVIPELTEAECDEIEEIVKSKSTAELRARVMFHLHKSLFSVLKTSRQTLESLVTLWAIKDNQDNAEPVWILKELPSTVVSYRPIDGNIDRIELMADLNQVYKLQEEAEQAAREEQELLAKEQELFNRLEQEEWSEVEDEVDTEDMDVVK